MLASVNWPLEVALEDLRSEIIRLRKVQSLARQQQVYGGFSPAERIEYDAREKRI